MRAMAYLDGLYILFCLGIGALFIYTGILKLIAPQTFATLIDAYGILPEYLLMPVAVILPVVEIAAGLGLVFNIRGSLSVVAVLLMLFVVILAYGIWMGLDVDCGCFGPQDPEPEAFHGLWFTLYRDLAVLAGTACVYGWRQYRAILPIHIKSLIKS